MIQSKSIHKSSIVMKNTLQILAFMTMCFILFLSGCTRDKLAPVVPGECIEGVEYTYNNLRPIIIRTCTNGSSCHNSSSARENYANYEDMASSLHNDPGGFTDWVIVRKEMPTATQPDDLQLTTEEFDRLVCWMEAGFPEK